MTSAPDHTGQTEFDIVATAARTRLDEEAKSKLQRLSETEPDWDRVVRLAGFHGVHPLLAQSLSGIEGVPTGVSSRLHSSMIRTAASNLVQARELGRLKRLFEQEDLGIIAFKGPVLASEVYENLGLRPSTDLDILVDARRFDEVETMLMRDGYSKVVRRDAGRMARSVHRYLAQQIPYVKQGNYAIDVHLNVMPPGYLYAFSFDALFERSHFVSLADTHIRGFESEDLLQVLCYHGVKNRYERLKHVCDIAELIRSVPDLNWDVIRRRAVHTRGEGVLNLGLYMTYSYFRSKTPPEVERCVLSDKRAVRFGNWLLERMPTNIDSGMPDFGQRFRLFLGIQDTLVNKARYCIYSVFRRLE